MKAQPLILLAGFILSSLFVQAQTAPQKGYYSIHKNAEKLNKKTKVTSNYVKPDSSSLGTNNRKATKGYYSIGNNKQNAGTAEVLLVENNDSAARRLVRPAVTKGYYSIGNNAQKLQRH